MTNDSFRNSDSQRSAAPLRHAESVVLRGALDLELGGQLPEVEVVYETWGRLSPSRDNVVLICHALTGDSHVVRHDASDDPGWWEVMVGPGRAIDTERWFVLCANVLGGCRGTTGPNSRRPGSDEPWGADFPTVTVGDMVEVQRRLLDELGIEGLRAVVGGSLGGFQALAWAKSYPSRVQGCVALASSPRLTAQAIAFDVVGRNAILRDPGFHGGQYHSASRGPEVGLALARMLAHITYLSPEAMREKFDPTRFQPRQVATEFEKRFSVGSYLAHQGDRFVERFDANSYVTLSLAMDLFDLGADPAALRAALREVRSRFLLISFTSDWLFPSAQTRQIVEALVAERHPVTWVDVRSSCGHDAFLLADDLAVYGNLTRSFLENLTPRAGSSREAGGSPQPPAVDVDAATSDPASQRSARPGVLDDRIVDLIPTGSSVLDLGCGGGELLSRLRARGHRTLVGVELDERALLACAARGLDVIQADLDQGVPPFAEGQFDVAILSQTLQSISDTAGILEALVRIGRRAVVSFPNFAFGPIREMLWREGRSPKADGPYGYDWWNTPNRRFPSIVDVEELCDRLGITIERRIYLDSARDAEVVDEPNRNADLAIVVLTKAVVAAPRTSDRRH